MLLDAGITVDFVEELCVENAQLLCLSLFLVRSFCSSSKQSGL